jgi:two-component system response regulator AtoC
MKKKILIVDDDSLVLKTLQNLLSRQNYEIICAKSGEEAIHYLELGDFSLVLSDIRMPGQDGIELLKKIRANGIETPFVFITGYASENAPIDAIKLGARDYLLKPFNLDELLESVKKYIA